MGAALQILGFGAISVDDIVYVDKPLLSGKGKVIRRATAHGGNVATALVTAAKLGARAGFLGWLNSDTEADASICDLIASDVDISNAPRHPDAMPVRSTITVGSDGDRFIAYDDDVMLGTTPDVPDSLLRAAKILLVDGYAISSLSVVRRARYLGLPIVADIEWSRGEATDQLAELADHLVLPLGYARLMTGCTMAPEILKRLWSETRTAVVLTDGSAGSFLRQRGDDQFWHIPAFPVDVVDTTGAGDCFHGAYAYALSVGCDPKDSAIFAGAAAALSVTGRGGRAAIPQLGAVNHLLGKLPSKGISKTLN